MVACATRGGGGGGGRDSSSSSRVNRGGGRGGGGDDATTTRAGGGGGGGGASTGGGFCGAPQATQPAHAGSHAQWPALQYDAQRATTAPQCGHSAQALLVQSTAVAHQGEHRWHIGHAAHLQC